MGVGVGAKSRRLMVGRGEIVARVDLKSRSVGGAAVVVGLGFEITERVKEKGERLGKEGKRARCGEWCR